MLETMPYFMTNKKWYTYDEKENMYYLTDEAPEKAKESYDKFIKTWNKPYDWFYGMKDEDFAKWAEAEKVRLDVEDNKK